MEPPARDSEKAAVSEHGRFLPWAGRGAFALALAAPLLVGVPSPLHPQSWRAVILSRQWGGERTLDVEVRFGAGRLSVAPAPEGLLYRMELRYNEDSFQPVAHYGEGRLRLGVEGVRGGSRWRSQEGNDMKLLLSRDVPMNLDLEFGAVRAEVELGGVPLSRLTLSSGASDSRVSVSAPNPIRMSSATFRVGAADFEAHGLGNLRAEQVRVNAGVGSLVLDFQGAWSGETQVSVDMGVGSLKLRFPRGLGVRLRRSTFLTSFDPEGLVKRGDSYYSLDWDTAPTRVSVMINGALGNVAVSWVR